jgi:predicted GIY-YIG superfamily endonuclease
MNHYYVYILESINHPNQSYVGITTDLEKRVAKHNEGGSPHTSNYKPWKLRISICFTDNIKAYQFEKYLKSHSGRAFTSKHF